MKIKEISPNKFTWDKCAVHNQYSMDDVLDNNLELQLCVEVVGWTQKNEIRPARGREIAVMFVISGEEQWIHLDKQHMERRGWEFIINDAVYTEGEKNER